MADDKNPSLQQTLNERAWEALDSLIRTLGTTLDIAEIIQRSLLAVTGQLLVRKAAFYLSDPDDPYRMTLSHCVGLRPSKLGNAIMELTPEALKSLVSDDGVAELGSDWGLSPHLFGDFQFASIISDGEYILGLLLLGGKLGARKFDHQDNRLLQAMGTVIGTSLKRTIAYQQLAEAKSRLEKAQVLQQQIIDHVSHEFNTPLMIVKSAAQFAQDTGTPDQEQFFHMHAQAVERLEELVQGVLDVANSRYDESDLESLEPRALVDRLVLPVIEASNWRDGGSSEEHHEPITDGWIQIDVAGLQKSLTAILDNAWSFAGPSPPRMLVQTYRANRRSWQSGDHLGRLALWVKRGRRTEKALLPFATDTEDPVMVIEVLDGGIGIPDDEQIMIFQPFVQASNSPTRGISGAGMGLASCQRHIEAMGGDILLYSRPNLGTLMAILLPISRTPSRAPSRLTQTGSFQPIAS